jgi:hypothetical protein
MMAMRRGSRPELALPGGRWDALDHAPRGTTPEVDAATGILSNAGGGTHRSDQGVFVARVASDGTVALTDRPNASVHVALPTLTDLGHGLAEWHETDRGRFGEPLDETKLAPLSRDFHVTAGASTDAGDRTTTVLVPVLAGGFDVNDWLTRRAGNDPYASRKRALLDATRDERGQIGKRHVAEQLAPAPRLMQRNLDALWATTSDPQVRKRALFELWDECAEVGDPALVEAGEAARRLVIGFIRARIPAGGPGAFTATEIVELAHIQRSTIAFRPYD